VQCGSCPAQQICIDGTSCQACDVCASGCTFSSVQAAIDAASPGATIRVCPGTYAESAASFAAIHIFQPLTLIGAGEGADPATNTILRPTQASREVVRMADAGTVRLERLRITGATGENGRGVNVQGLADATNATFAHCAITGNHSTANSGGGLTVDGGPAVNPSTALINTRITDNSSPGIGGINLFQASLTLDVDSRVRDNEATDQEGAGGIMSVGSTVHLPSVNNVTGNTPNDCQNGGASTFTGSGAVCLTT
jgi:hypothetical protein